MSHLRGGRFANLFNSAPLDFIAFVGFNNRILSITCCPVLYQRIIVLLRVRFAIRLRLERIYLFIRWDIIWGKSSNIALNQSQRIQGRVLKSHIKRSITLLCIDILRPVGWGQRTRGIKYHSVNYSWCDIYPKYLRILSNPFLSTYRTSDQKPMNKERLVIVRALIWCATDFRLIVWIREQTTSNIFSGMYRMCSPKLISHSADIGIHR